MERMMLRGQMPLPAACALLLRLGLKLMETGHSHRCAGLLVV